MSLDLVEATHKISQIYNDLEQMLNIALENPVESKRQEINKLRVDIIERLQTLLQLLHSDKIEFVDFWSEIYAIEEKIKEVMGANDISEGGFGYPGNSWY